MKDSFFAQMPKNKYKGRVSCLYAHLVPVCNKGWDRAVCDVKASSFSYTMKNISVEARDTCVVNCRDTIARIRDIQAQSIPFKTSMSSRALQYKLLSIVAL